MQTPSMSCTTHMRTTVRLVKVVKVFAGSAGQSKALPSTSAGVDDLAAQLANAQPGNVDGALLAAAAAAVCESSGVQKQLKRAREVEASFHLLGA